LRMRAEVSQEKLAKLIGVSRQTYGAIERGIRKMTWTVFLSLVLYFECNQKSRKTLHAIKPISDELFLAFNDGEQPEGSDLRGLFGEEMAQICSSLDEQAMESIKTVILLEYVRCTSPHVDSIIKSFGGGEIKKLSSEAIANTTAALNVIRKRTQIDDKP